MAIRTTTVTINAAFLREIKEDNQRLKELLAELREALGERPTNDALTRHQLIEKLSDFRDLLATHFALEEAFGYFDEPLMAAPRLAERAEELRQEHARLFVRLCGLVDQAEDIFQREPHERAYRLIAEQFRQFDSDLQVHEQAENELIMEAFNADIGVGD